MSKYLLLRYMAVLTLFSVPGASASAQDLSAFPMPPDTPAQDEFGVNVLDRTWTYRTKQVLHTDIDPDMDFYLMTGNGGVRWGSSLQAYVVGDPAPYQAFYNVVIGEKNILFSTINGSNIYTEASEGGNTLTYDVPSKKFTFTRRDGTKFIFDTQIFNTQPAGSTGRCSVGRRSSTPLQCGAATSAIFPDGKTISFEYETSYVLASASLNSYNTYANLIKARSSSGISVYIKNINGTHTAKMINDAFEYCNYATFTCSGNHPWPSLSYSMTEVTLPSGRPGTVTMITDQQGASFRHETTRFASDFKVFKSGVGSPLAIHYANNQGGGGRDGPSLPGYIEHTGANGIRYNYQYSDVSTPSGLEVRGTRTSSDGRVYSFVGNPSIPKSSVVVQETDEIGRVTNFTYDNRRRPLEIKFPEGNSENYTYDQNGNITEIRRKSKPGSGIADIVKTIGYPSPCSGPLLCNKPTSIVDERGGLTNYSWDPVTGNLLTHSLPADANGIRPVKRYLYANMYAWVSNGSGGFVQSAAPRSMLTEERSCLTTATIGTSCAGGAADEVVTAYYYGPPSGPNNLLLKGKSTTAGGVTLVECYGYDKLGNKISTTKPNANLQVCP